MNKQTPFDKLREWIGGIAFDVFLWSIRMTAEQYRNILLYEEMQIRASQTPPLRYWQHGETGRVTSSPILPSERWAEITKEQYENHNQWLIDPSS